jgi:hypothetical protein
VAPLVMNVTLLTLMITIQKVVVGKTIHSALYHQVSGLKTPHGRILTSTDAVHNAAPNAHIVTTGAILTLL